MTRMFRSLARRLLGVARPPTYYLPWIVRPGLECALVLSNVEARFKPEHGSGPFRASVVQYDARGVAAHVYEVSLQSSTDALELPLKPADGGCGFVTVTGDRIQSDLYPAPDAPAAGGGLRGGVPGRPDDPSLCAKPVRLSGS